MTNNARHLVPIAAELLGTGGSHAGLVLASDRSLPRAMGSVGDLIGAVETLLAAHPADEALRDQVRWLAAIG